MRVGGVVKSGPATEMEQELLRLLDEPALRQRMGNAARAMVLEQQGATKRTLDVLDAVLAAQGRPHTTAERFQVGFS